MVREGIMSIGNKYGFHSMYYKPSQPKKRPAPASVRMSNATAEVVLRERKVEIKDLESHVTYLQNQIKAIKVENKTLREIQGRQEKELRKFREGVADIPSLLRSHKDEIKAFESTASSLRRELRDCQKELKLKYDAILRKDQQIEKLSASSKRNEKHLQEVSSENKELKTEKKKLDEDCKKLSGTNEELKSKNERLQKKIQQMTSKILNLEESLGSSDHHKTQLKEDLSKLQRSYDELQQNLNMLKSRPAVVTIATQTDYLSHVSYPPLSTCIDSKNINHLEDDRNVKISENWGMKDSGVVVDEKSDDSYHLQRKISDITAFHGDQVHHKHSQPPIAEAKVHKSFLLQPMKSKSSFPLKTRENKSDFISIDSSYDTKPYFSFNSPYMPSNVFQSGCVTKKVLFRNSPSKMS